ncbi:hypothetical protein AVEN_108200-1, partial [Araneus ventricosus]
MLVTMPLALLQGPDMEEHPIESASRLLNSA